MRTPPIPKSLQHAHLNHAITLATTYHADQVDKQGLPYILHPLRVMTRARTITHQIIAVLHDTLEDTALTESDLRGSFPDEIVDAVLALTRNKDNETYKEFIVRVARNPLAREVKLLDIEDNSRPDRYLPEMEGLRKRYAKAHMYLRLRAKFSETEVDYDEIWCSRVPIY